MAVQIAEDTTSLRAKQKPLPIPVNPNDESQDTVELVFCEFPAGLLEELEGEALELGEAITEVNKNLASARRRVFDLEAKITALDLSSEDYRQSSIEQFQAELDRLKKVCEELRAKRTEIKATRRGKQFEIIAWGVCDHNPKDFLRGSTEVPFKPEIGVYDGLQYRIASVATVRQYASVGTDFIDCLYMSVTNFQRQVILTPRKIWDETRQARERLGVKLRALLDRAMANAVNDATEQSAEDQIAEAGGELGAEEPDPNAKRALEKATPEL